MSRRASFRFLLSVLTALSGPAAVAGLIANGGIVEMSDGGWSLLRLENADSLTYLLASDSRDGGQRVEMSCHATVAGELPPSLSLVGQGSGKAELATLGPATTTGELEITDGKAPPTALAVQSPGE